MFELKINTLLPKKKINILQLVKGELVVFQPKKKK